MRDKVVKVLAPVNADLTTEMATEFAFEFDNGAFQVLSETSTEVAARNSTASVSGSESSVACSVLSRIESGTIGTTCQACDEPTVGSNMSALSANA